MSDSRSSKRFPLHLPIAVREGDSAAAKIGTTQNVSAAGVYITADADLEVGSEVEFDIILPASVIGGDKDVQVRCHGRVVRSEPRARAADAAGGSGQDEKAGLACVIEHYKFVRE